MDRKVEKNLSILIAVAATISILIAAVVFSAQALAQGTYVCSYNIDRGCWVAEEQSSCAEGYFGICEGNDVIECLANTGNECVGGPPLASKVSNLYKMSLGIGTLLALGIIIYGGVRYTASGGNSSATGEAKKWISAAAFGLVILFGSYLLIKLLNPDLLTLTDPTTQQNEPQPPPNVTFTLPGTYGVVPGDGGIDLSTLPAIGSGTGALLLCGNANTCETGTYLNIEVDSNREERIADIEDYPGNTIRSDQFSYIVFAGDLARVVLYEDLNFSGVRITLERNPVNNRVSCTYEYYAESNNVVRANCSSDLVSVSTGSVGLNLHNICIRDDNRDGNCSNNWGDDITSLVITGINSGGL